MSLFDKPLEGKSKKPVSVHPWAHTIKDEHLAKIKYAHNSITNEEYPKPRQSKRSKRSLGESVTFIVIGNRVTREFLYCVNLVKGIHKYRSKKYKAPIIKGCTGLEWFNEVWIDLKTKYGEVAHCLQSQVAVICNNELIGGEKELAELIGTKYYYRVVLNYQKESIKQFANHIKASGLHSDVVPHTCENFLRLCQLKKGGYSGTPVHRIVKDGWIQCGGFGLKSIDLGCENFIVPHDRRGVIGMANDGRHVDCSTQFFVLLQPSEWMQSKYVAFGQLIDGEETLKKIEQVETIYESPVPKIIIYSAGVLNLECQDIMINRGAQAYIDKHIENLFIIGELFYEMLMENVFLEIEFRNIQKLMPQEGEGVEAFGDTVDDQGNYIKENIRATRRFMRKKEEFQRNVDTDQKDDRSHKSATSKDTQKDNEEKNNDFDVDEYSSFGQEEYSYQKATPPISSVEVKPNKPYYLALTDVPYPGETDSNFDLKKFLKGDYCLETDLAKVGKKSAKPDKEQIQQFQDLERILSGYQSCQLSDEDISSDDLDSDDAKEIRTYLLDNSDTVSFAGVFVKNIAKKFIADNPLRDETFTDEDLRRLQLAKQELKSQKQKRVSLGVEPWQEHKQIKRRQTGFVPSFGLPDLSDEEDDDVDEDDDEPDYSKKLSVQINAPLVHTPSHIQRRPTGFVSQGDIDLLDELEKLHEEDMKKKSLKATVRIDSQTFETEINGRETVIRNTLVESSVDKAKIRPSVLMRLYEENAVDDKEIPPTLKHYKPKGEYKRKSELLSSPTDVHDDNIFLRKDKGRLKQSVDIHHDSSDIVNNVPRRKHGSDGISGPESFQKVAHPFQIAARSIRSFEYAKVRPALSVLEYQKLNEESRKHQMNAAANESLEQMESKKIGLRLPGDSPLYECAVSPNHSEKEAAGKVQLF